ncbi:unnamed protein product [Owenia fusiformis]|uniref:FGFR1 oncogene partner 2 homolog n=1 Tax=Owenia fusiformis TaxID=6347 RepID=A0A8S4MXZ5_OWEFU|nr:unnamed protein product [Owenia fusiformis]
MSLTIQKVLCDAKMLVDRLKDHDNSADTLISQAHTLNKRIDAMRTYEEEIQQLNQVARHRPRSTLVLGIAQENRQIRELQHENKELRLSLEEHQSALELVMSKYREQILKLVMANKQDQAKSPTGSVEDNNQMLEKIDKIYEMAAVMQKAVAIDDAHGASQLEKIQKLEIENEGLREMLDISNIHNNISKDATPVTDDDEPKSPNAKDSNGNKVSESNDTNKTEDMKDKDKAADDTDEKKT